MLDDKTRALLGDHEAAKRLTEAGVLLPCPHCGSNDIILSNWGMFRCWCPDCHAKGEDCLSQIDAAKHWNTRAPILSESEMKKLSEGGEKID